MWNRNVPFGLAVGMIVLVSGVVGAGIYCQSVALPDVDPVVAPMAKPSAPSEKTATTKIYRNDAYGLEFAYSPEWGGIDMKEGDSGKFSIEKDDKEKDDNWFFLDTQMENPGENDFYNIPKGTAVDDWIIKKQGKVYEDEGNGYFSNKIGQEFDIAGLKTLHLVSRSWPFVKYDEFYFVKDDRLFYLAIGSGNSIMEMGDLKLNDDSQWYTQLLKSFRVVDVR